VVEGQDCSFEDPAKLRGFGRLPKELIDDPSLTDKQLFFLAYRSLYDSEDWGCHPRTMVRAVRKGFSRHVFCETVRQVKEKGLLEREQGKRKGPGPGRGYAVDRLAFEAPERSFVKIDRSLFSGGDNGFTPVEIACVIYLSSCGSRGAKRWQIAKRFNLSLPTVSKILKRLTCAGRIANNGTAQVPVYVVKDAEVKIGGASQACKKSVQQKRVQQHVEQQKLGPDNKSKAFNEIKSSRRINPHQAASTGIQSRSDLVACASNSISGTQLSKAQAKSSAGFSSGAMTAAVQAIVRDVAYGKSIAGAARFNTSEAVWFHGDRIGVPMSVRKQLDRRAVNNVQALVDRAAKRKGRGTPPSELWRYVIGIANGDAETRAKKLLSARSTVASTKGEDRIILNSPHRFGEMEPPSIVRLWVDGRARAEGIDPNAVLSVWRKYGGVKEYLDCLDIIRKERTVEAFRLGAA
jgi:hypothetical protein